MPLFAAYGPLLDPHLMAERCPHSPLTETGWLTGWRLTFGGEDLGWDGAIVTLVEDPAGAVFVGLYEMSREDLRVLEEWESVDTGLHREVRTRVQTLTGSQPAFILVLDAFEGGLPSAHYLGMISEAALKAGAPDDYVRDLRERPCGRG